jgi:hypothetical protein
MKICLQMDLMFLINFWSVNLLYTVYVDSINVKTPLCFRVSLVPGFSWLNHEMFLCLMFSNTSEVNVLIIWQPKCQVTEGAPNLKTKDVVIYYLLRAVVHLSALL